MRRPLSKREANMLDRERAILDIKEKAAMILITLICISGILLTLFFSK